MENLESETNNNYEEEQLPVLDSGFENANPEQIPDDTNKPSQKRRTFWVFGSIVGLLLVIIIGALIGYQNGINKRLNREESIKTSKAAEQYELGVTDLEQGRFELARERFEYVINLVPNYPGAADKLREVLLEIYNLKTPTPNSPSTPDLPTAVPTTDYRGADDLFNSVLQLIIAEDWNEAITTMDLLRQNFIEYKPVDVDGLYYIALRNRGVEKILAQGSLEQGIYDLSLAERFAPLDGEADGYRTWARLYLTGASYWDVNWEQVIYYFSQVQPAFPYLRDGSGLTATDRYRIGLMRYGDQFALAGDFCKAKEYYDQAFVLGSDESAQATATFYFEECEKLQQPTPPPAVTPTPEKTKKPTKTPTEEVPLPTPTPTP